MRWERSNVAEDSRIAIISAFSGKVVPNILYLLLFSLQLFPKVLFGFMEWNEVVHGEISFILFHHLLLFLFPPIWGAQGIIQFLKLLNIKVSLSRSHKLLNIYFFFF